MADDLTYPADAMREAAAEARHWKARHDDLAAAVAADAIRAAKNDDFERTFALRALLADPAAFLADRDRRMKAEALEQAAERGPVHFAAAHTEARWRGYGHLVTVDYLRNLATYYREGGRADD